jgi:hypothetical protein
VILLSRIIIGLDLSEKTPSLATLAPFAAAMVVRWLF